jgi:ABC-type multidrug transport system fused ATPase/permease subunit
MDAFRRVLAFLHKEKKDFWISVITVLVETGFELIIPLIMAKMLDEGVEKKNLNLVYICGALIAVCALMSLVNGILYSKFAARAAAKFGASIREAQFQAIQDYSFSNLDRFEPSSLVTRVINDSMTMQSTLAGGLRPLVRAPLMLILGIVLSLVINWQLAMIFIALTPVLALLLYFILRFIAPQYISLQKKLDELNGKIQEDLVAIRAVKAFVRKPYECEKFDVSNAEYRDIIKKTNRVAALNVPAFQFIMYLATVLFMWFGGNMIIQGTLQVGSLTGILSYVMQTFNSLMMISNIFVLLSKSLASVYRINQVLEEKPNIISGSDKESIRRGDIFFSHVSFRYSPTAPENVLTDISFQLEGGKTMGILGPTGSAKSTLVQLIPRLYDVSSGQILIDGKDVRAYSLYELRESIGMVLQKNVLFEGTILDNLKWGAENPDPQELNEALRISCADEFISKMPEGLNTQVGEGGNELSGGQKQRLCLARALLKKPKILILDDACSAVDTATERKIRTGLNSITGMTKIIISQRILSVMEADQILILKDGKISDMGTHQSLLSSDPIYQDLFNSQLKGVIGNG